MSKSQSPNFFLITEQRYRNYSKHNASIRNHLNTPHHEHSTVYTPSTPNHQRHGHRTVHSTHQRGSSELPRHIPHRHTTHRPVRTDISDLLPRPYNDKGNQLAPVPSLQASRIRTGNRECFVVAVPVKTHKAVPYKGQGEAVILSG